MSDQPALLRAIAADPDDDTPRLVYADWLQEHGDARDRDRAEFIRLQIGAHGRPADDPSSVKAEALLKKHRAKWLAPFGKAFAADAGFERGFVSTVNLQAESLDPGRPPPWHLEPCTQAWLKGAEAAAVRALPALVGAYGLAFDLDDPPELTRDEDESADEDRLTDTPLRDHPGDRLAAAVAAVPGFASLRSLNLMATRVTDVGARVLAASHLRGLRELNLWWNRMTAAGWKALAGSPVVDGVRELDLTADGDDEEREELGQPYPGNRGAAALAASPRLANVRVLKIGDSRIGKPGAAALSASRNLGAVEFLDLNGLEWPTGPLAAFLAGDPFPRLKYLSLHRNRIGPAEARVLARSSLLARLPQLHLGHCEMNAAAVAELAAAPDLSRLEDLNLLGNEFGDAGVEALARCETLTGLRRLCLAYVRLTDRAADALLAAPWLKGLEHLDLDGSRMPCAGSDRLKIRLGSRVSFK